MIIIKKFSFQHLLISLICFLIAALLIKSGFCSTDYFLLFPINFVLLGIVALLFMPQSFKKNHWRILEFTKNIASLSFLVWSIILFFLTAFKTLWLVALLSAFVAFIPLECNADFASCYLLAVFGNVACATRVATCYVTGEGTRKNAHKAYKWFKRAAHKNDSDAQYYLGVFYEYGIVCDADLAEAMKWYFLAADNGHPLAYQRLNEPIIKKTDNDQIAV